MEFQLERYRFILQEISNLNANTHKYLTLFQTLATAIISAIVIIFVNWKKLEINYEIAIASIRGFYFILLTVGLFTISRIIAGVFSWFDYRKEEVELLDSVVRPGFRKPPTFKNFWRWDEFYIIVFLFLFLILAIVLTELFLVPKIM